MIGIAERERKQESIRREKELRRKEERIMAGVRPARPACRPQSGRRAASGGEEEGITLEEYKRRAGIESLAEMIGKKAGGRKSEVGQKEKL